MLLPSIRSIHIRLECFFLTDASPATPIMYYVEQLRKGRSYVTSLVKAVQKGVVIFILVCSFQKPEPWQPSHQWTMPSCPDPSECQLEEDRLVELSKQPDLHPKLKKIYEDRAAVRIKV
jgi:acyl-CoA thioesterase 8